MTEPTRLAFIAIKKHSWHYACPAGAYSETSLISLIALIVRHRFWHFCRGDGWRD